MMKIDTSAAAAAATSGVTSSYSERTKHLRDILSSNEMTIMPCCYDGLSARLVEQSGIVGFEAHSEPYRPYDSE